MFVIITTILFASLLSPQQTFAQVPVCGGRLTSDAGTFHTPHYPHEYDTNTMCKWVIEVPVGRVVELKFSNFDIDADYEPEKCPMDRVQVHDGETTDSPSLGGVLCGQETPDAITSTGRFMTVLFQSRDDSIGGVGFQAAYKALPGVDHPRCIMNSCGGEISDKVNCEIQSPGYPSGYADNLNCTWVIRAPSGVGKVVFTFTEADFNRKMDGKCSMNNVTVHDGANIKSKVIYEPNCDTRDNRLKTTVFRSTGPVLLINMRTSKMSTLKHGFNGNFVVEGGVTTLPITTTTKAPTTTTTTTIPTTTPTTTTTTTVSTTLKQLISRKSSPSTTKAQDKIQGKSSDYKDGKDTVPATEAPEDNSISHNPAAVSGLVVGCVVAVAVIVFGILLFIAFVHWKRQNHRFNIRLREEDNRSDVNTLISSVDSREFNPKDKGGKIVKVTEEEEPMFQL